jgi:hypothetical protein
MIDYGLCNKPYRCREFELRDLDGYDLGFGQLIPNPAAFLYVYLFSKNPLIVPVVAGLGSR